MRLSEVNEALLAPRLKHGVTAKAMGIVWGPSALSAMMLGSSISWWYAPIPVAIGAVIHSVLKYIFKKEPKIFEMYAKYSLMSSDYHPHARSKLPPAFERPTKVGRDLRL